MGEGNLALPRAKANGAVLLHPKKRAEVGGGFRLTTNNRMEIFTPIASLEWLKQPRQGIGFAWHHALRGSAAEGKVPP